jgi:hypothetical protein
MESSPTASSNHSSQAYIYKDFPHAYEAQILSELPPGPDQEPRWYFPGRPANQDGITVRVFPPGSPTWLGTFAFGRETRGVVNRAMSWPEPLTLCVISSGKGYAVRADDPHKWFELATYPIFHVRSVPSKGIVLIGDHCRVAAYGSAGLLWRTAVAWDGFVITNSSGESAIIEAFKPGHRGKVTRAIDLTTGKITEVLPETGQAS